MLPLMLPPFKDASGVGHIICLTQEFVPFRFQETNAWTEWQVMFQHHFGNGPDSAL